MRTNIGILGGFGFVGTNLVNYLRAANYEVIPASRKNGIDATNPDVVVSWLKNNAITHLVVLSAECGGIGLNAKHPADLWRSVSHISHTILEAAHCAAGSLYKTVMVGTVCSYAKDSPVPFSETDLMNYGPPEPTNLAYGVAKLSALYGAQAYAKQHNMRLANLIPVNMYGPHDHFDLEHSHVIPAIIRKIDNAIADKKPQISLWGTGNATREFLYIKDFCSAVKLAMFTETPTDFINIGTGSEISIRDLAAKIAAIMGYEGTIWWDHTKPDGQPRRCLNIERARQYLGYKPSVNIDDGLRDTVSWYKRTYHNQVVT